MAAVNEASVLISPVHTINFVGDATVAELDTAAATAKLYDTYHATDAGTPAAGSSDLLASGDFAQWNGNEWIRILNNVGGVPVANARVILSAQTALVAPYAGDSPGEVFRFDGSASTAENTKQDVVGNAVFITSGAQANSLLAYNGTAWLRPVADRIGDEFELLTTANNGKFLEFGKLYVAINDGSGDIQLNLPPLADAQLTQGLNILIVATASSIEQTELTPAAGDVVFGAGYGPGETPVFQRGSYRFSYLVPASAGFGGNTWEIDDELGQQSYLRPTVDLFSDTAIPAFTDNGGVGPTLILTADANGSLVIDGVTVSSISGLFSVPWHGVLLADDGVYNGVYDVIDAGDGSNPFILRLRTDWATFGSYQVPRLLGIRLGDRYGGSTIMSQGSVSPMPPPLGGVALWTIPEDLRLSGAAQVLVDAATIIYDASVKSDAIVTLGGDRILNWTNPKVGQRGIIRIVQDGSPPRLITAYQLAGAAADVDFAGGTAPTLTSAAAAVDILEWYYDGSTIQLRVFALDSK